MNQPQEKLPHGSDYDPENDQVLKMLKEQSHRSSVKIPTWLWTTVVLALIVLGILWMYSTSTVTPVPAPTPVETTAEVVPPEPPPPTPLELATEWRDLTLSGTQFEGLEIRERDGSFYLEYRARSGDSIPKIVSTYGDLFPSDDVPVVERAKTFHAADYGRGLWVGDSIYLLIPPQVGS